MAIVLRQNQGVIRDSGAADIVAAAHEDFRARFQKVEEVYQKFVYFAQDRMDTGELKSALRGARALQTTLSNSRSRLVEQNRGHQVERALQVMEKLVQDVEALKNIYLQGKPHSTADEFHALHEANVFFEANIRGKVYREYQRLLEQEGAVRGLLRDYPSDEELSLDRETVIVRSDLFHQAKWKFAPSTQVTFHELHHANVAFERDMRGEVYNEYNRLLRERNGGKGQIRDHMDQTSMIVRKDLFEEARRAKAPKIGDYFDELHKLNIRHGADIRGKVNERYNQLLQQHNGSKGMIQGNIGMDRGTWIIRPDLYRQAKDAVIHEQTHQMTAPRRLSPARSFQGPPADTLVVMTYEEHTFFGFGRSQHVFGQVVFQGSHTPPLPQPQQRGGWLSSFFS